MERMDIGAMVQGRAAISRMKQTAAARRAPGATTAPGATGLDRVPANFIGSPLAGGMGREKPRIEAAPADNRGRWCSSEKSFEKMVSALFWA
jgi:hypothetical protein